MTARSFILALAACLSGPLALAQAQLCLWDDVQIGGYYGEDADPFSGWGCLHLVGLDTTVWRPWPGVIEGYQLYGDCPYGSWLVPGVSMLETAAPYPPAKQDTITIQHGCNGFPSLPLAQRLALANANEQAGLPDQVLDGTEQWLLTIVYNYICYDLDTLTDHVTTRISVDNGTTWIDASDPGPFQTQATATACAGWNSWDLYWSTVASAKWTGTGNEWLSRHVFDLFQGYRALYPHYTDPYDYLAAWQADSLYGMHMSTVLQQFIFHSDSVSSGKPGWRLPTMHVTYFHVRDNTLGLTEEVPDGKMDVEVRYGPMPILHLRQDLGPGKVSVYDGLGRQVQMEDIGTTDEVPLVTSMHPGFYIARITASDGRSWSIPFVNP